MANCIPQELPEWVLQDERRTAEIKVFNKCNSELSDEWHVFYSRPWWGINERGGEKDGEADFILAHPQLGILFIEVKGGKINYDEKADQWSTTDRHGITHNLKRSPVQQAISSKHELLKKFQKNPNWPKSRVLAHHGVIFVDTVDADLKLLGGYEREIFCLSLQFERDFLAWVTQRLTNHREKNETGPGDCGIKAIHDILAKPLQLRTTLWRTAEAEIAAMNQLLTGLQLQALAEVENSTRLVIEGGAGTGKTVIACELALRARDTQIDVALCSVSESLLVNLKTRLSKENPRLEILSITDLIKGKKNYDLIIIDESQDVDWGDWPKIENRLSKPESKLVCFMDSNQAIYRLATDLELVLQAKKFTLRVNLRNTKKIGRVISEFYDGPVPLVSGPEGIKPNLTIVPDIEKAVIGMCDEIRKLNSKEGVDYGSIAVLSDDKEFTRKFTQALRGFNVLISSAKNRTFNSLTLDSIFNFKGLESPFVFVFADSEGGNNKEISYVATSRARAYLSIYSINRDLQINRAIPVS